jgi:hypothetical protein
LRALIQWIVLIWVAAIGLALLVGLWLAERGRSRRSKRRNRIARRGELAAAKLLARAGYEVIERNAIATVTFEIDGERVEVGVRADLLVSNSDGEILVAEVKTGLLAPDPRHGPTRRQLLEYAIAFDSPVVLLVDMQAGDIHRVEFSASARLLAVRSA